MVLGYSQLSCSALPSAETDGTLLGPAGRHVRRLINMTLKIAVFNLIFTSNIKTYFW